MHIPPTAGNSCIFFNIILFMSDLYLILFSCFVNNFSNWNNSSQKSERGQSQTIFVRGFDTSLGEDEVILSLLSDC